MKRFGVLFAEFFNFGFCFVFCVDGCLWVLLFDLVNKEHSIQTSILYLDFWVNTCFG